MSVAKTFTKEEFEQMVDERLLAVKGRMVTDIIMSVDKILLEQIRDDLKAEVERMVVMHTQTKSLCPHCNEIVSITLTPLKGSK